MSKKPPVPADNQSPYPAEESPHEHHGEGEAIAAAKEMAASRRWTPSRKTWGLGAAAVGVGSAAVVAALLFARSSRKDGKS